MSTDDLDAVIEAAAQKVRAMECEYATGLIPWDRMEDWAKDLQCRHVRVVAEVIAPALRAGALRGLADVLAKHYLAEVACDHERREDNPRCACSLVHLGWHPSVGQAVDAWIEHVLTMLRERADWIGGAT